MLEAPPPPKSTKYKTRPLFEADAVGNVIAGVPDTQIITASSYPLESTTYDVPLISVILRVFAVGLAHVGSPEAKVSTFPSVPAAKAVGFPDASRYIISPVAVIGSDIPPDAATCHDGAVPAPLLVNT